MTLRNVTITNLLGAVFVAVAFLTYDMLLPVNAKQAQSAIVLSKAGPRGAAAYREAIADDVITRQDMRRLRYAAGQDIDADTNLEGRHPGS